MTGDSAATSNSATTLKVEGMTCNNCARHVIEAIQAVPGVQSVSVALESARASVRWSAGANADVSAVVAAVEHAGFRAQSLPNEPEKHDHAHDESHGWQLNLSIGVIGTVPLMIGEWVFGLAMTPWFQWFSFVVATVVQVFAGGPFYRGAWRQLRRGNSNMDTLVALGSTTAFAYSTWALFKGVGGHVYFMEAASIITLISVGHWIEARVSSRASDSLKALLHLAPQMARRIEQRKFSTGLPSLNPTTSPAFTVSPSGRGLPKNFAALKTLQPAQVAAPREVGISTPNEVEVPVAELRIGDLILLKPGDRVPTDATVTEGESALDESMLTGESVPVDKKAGSELYAGTTNVNGRLIARVTATGEATALAHIIASVQRAQTSRADIQRLGDRVSSVFVPIVVTVAIAAGLWWGLAHPSAMQVHAWLGQFLWPAQPPGGTLAAAFIISAAVLIVACPCAMGLATPAAIMASANAAARRGILIRDGIALEKAGKITAVVFDKTGTLTVGKPAVAVLEDLRDLSDRAVELSKIAASLAAASTHPLSQAVARHAEPGLTMVDWQEMRGAGVQGRVAEVPAGATLYRLGSLRWLNEVGVKTETSATFAEFWMQQGATVLGVAADTTLIGLIALRDGLKPQAGGVIRRLNHELRGREGSGVYLMTGDNRRTAESIAREAGIDPGHIFAEVRPEQKAELVKTLQARGERVAFVGDGINDAPALEQADLGIAVSRASDVAREAADIILLKSEIEAVPEALGLARATLRTIKQNLFWAFFYNALGIPLAALGFMSPILCAAAMGLSDVVVIGNALRLRRWRLKN